jgi:hypothetical protein
MTVSRLQLDHVRIEVGDVYTVEREPRQGAPASLWLWAPVLLGLIGCRDSAERSPTRGQAAVTTPPAPPEPEPLTAMPIVLSEALEPRRVALTALVAEGQRIARSYCVRHSLSACVLGAEERLEVFAAQRELWAACLGATEGAAAPHATTVGAALPERLCVTTPEILARVLPEYVALRPDAWTRLVAHEVFHRLVPGRGPRWFVEGLAVIAADQGFGEELRFGSDAAALTAVDWDDRHAYAEAAARVRHFAARTSIEELYRHAGEEGFAAWLLTRRPP